MSASSQVSGPPPSPAPTQGGADGQGPPGTNASNLYLVTFLATLFLLLFVSCAIILRSYLLRRRYQRQVQVALGAGMLLTPRSPGSRYARFGHLPKLFHSWIMPGGAKWKDIHPVAAQPVFVKKRRRDSVALKSLGVDHPTPSTSTTSPTYGVRSLFSRFRRPQQHTASPPNSSEAVEVCPHSRYPPPLCSSKTRVEMLQISVLIAMPSQSQSLRKNALVDSNNQEDDEDAPLPELVLGITKTPYRHKTLDSKPTPQPSTPSPSDIPSS